MKLIVTKLEHASLLIEYRDSRIVIDPGCLTSQATLSRLTDIDAVLVSHKHADHCDIDVLKKIGATVFGPPEVVALATGAGINAEPLIIGKAKEIAGLLITAIPADHGPAVSKLVENLGFVIKAADVRIFFTGDVCGPQLSPPPGPFALVALPIEGGGFVFSPLEAANFLDAIKHSGAALPVHTDDTVGLGGKFAAAARSICHPTILTVGETLEV